MTRRRIFGLVSILWAVMPQLAWGWNSIGHMTVAKLAYDQLGDAHKTKLFNLLRSHPHYQAYLAAGRPAEISEVEWVIVRSSVWPDWVRPRGASDPRGAEVTRYNRPEDHYVNVPFVDPKDQDAFAGKVLVDPDVTNILDALKQRCNEVRTKTTTDADKAIALCWIAHLIGDIHQPMHNVSYFSDTKAYRRGDLGGNLFGVRAAGQRVKLHAFWDDLLSVDSDYGDDSAKHQASIYHDAIKTAARLRNLKLVDAEQEKLAKNTTFASWSRESHELAKSVAYQRADGSGLLAGVLVPFKGPIPENAPEVGDDYIRAARVTADIRVVLASHRLAERIKLLLAK